MFIRIDNPNQYKKIIDTISMYANKISIVTSINEDFEQQRFYHKFKQNFISSKITKKWPGTITTSKSIMYTYIFDNDVKDFLKSYNSFFKEVKEDGYTVIVNLDNIQADISFFKDDSLLLYTTTHEKIICVEDGSLKDYIRRNLNGVIIK